MFNPGYFALATHAFAVAIRAGVHNSLGWVAGIVRPFVVFVELAEKMATVAEAAFVESAELVAVTVTVAGEGTAEGAV